MEKKAELTKVTIKNGTIHVTMNVLTSKKGRGWVPTTTKTSKTITLKTAAGKAAMIGYIKEYSPFDTELGIEDGEPVVEFIYDF